MNQASTSSVLTKKSGSIVADLLQSGHTTQEVATGFLNCQDVMQWSSVGSSPEAKLKSTVIGVPETPHWNVASPTAKMSASQTGSIPKAHAMSSNRVINIESMASATSFLMQTKAVDERSESNQKPVQLSQQRKKKLVGVVKRKPQLTKRAMRIVANSQSQRTFVAPKAGADNLMGKAQLQSANYKRQQKPTMKTGQVGLSQRGMLKLERTVGDSSTNVQTDVFSESQRVMGLSDDVQAYLGSNMIDMFSPADKRELYLKKGKTFEEQCLYNARQGFASVPKLASPEHAHAQLLSDNGSHFENLGKVHFHKDLARQVFTANGLIEERDVPRSSTSDSRQQQILSALGSLQTIQPSQQDDYNFDHRQSQIGDNRSVLEKQKTHQQIGTGRQNLFSYIAHKPATTTVKDAQARGMVGAHSQRVIQTFSEQQVPGQIPPQQYMVQHSQRTDQFGKKKLLSSKDKEQLMQPQFTTRSQYFSPGNKSTLTNNLFEHSARKLTQMSAVHNSRAIAAEQSDLKKHAKTFVEMASAKAQSNHQDIHVKIEQGRSGNETPDLPVFSKDNDSVRKSINLQGLPESGRTSCVFGGQLPGDDVRKSQERVVWDRLTHNRQSSHQDTGSIVGSHFHIMATGLKNGRGLMSDKKNNMQHVSVNPLHDDDSLINKSLKESQSTDMLARSNPFAPIVSSSEQQQKDQVLSRKMSQQILQQPPRPYQGRRTIQVTQASNQGLNFGQEQAKQLPETTKAPQKSVKVRMLHQMPYRRKNSAASSVARDVQYGNQKSSNPVSIVNLKKNWRGIIPDSNFQQSKAYTSQRPDQKRRQSNGSIEFGSIMDHGCPKGSSQDNMHQFSEDALSRQDEMTSIVYMTQPQIEQPSIVDQDKEQNKHIQKIADLKTQASRRDSRKSGRPTIPKSESMENQRNVMNFNESPDVGKRGLSPDLEHILDLPSSIKQPVKASMLTSGQEFSLIEELPEHLKKDQRSSLAAQVALNKKHDNKDIAIVIQSVEVQEGVTSAKPSLKTPKAQQTQAQNCKADAQPDSKKSSPVKICLDQNELRIAAQFQDSLLNENAAVTMLSPNETLKTSTYLSPQHRRTTSKDQLDKNIPDKVSKPYIEAHLKSVQTGREMTKQVNAYQKKLRQDNMYKTQSNFAFGGGVNQSIGHHLTQRQKQRDRALMHLKGEKVTLPSSSLQQHLNTQRLGYVSQTSFDMSNGQLVGGQTSRSDAHVLQDDFINTMQQVTKQRAQKINQATNKQNQRIKKYASRLEQTTAAKPSVTKQASQPGNGESKPGRDGRLLLNKEVHMRMKALPRTGRLSRLQADPFKKFVIKTRDGQEQIKQETKSLINQEYEKSSIEFQNKSISSMHDGSSNGTAVKLDLFEEKGSVNDTLGTANSIESCTDLQEDESMKDYTTDVEQTQDNEAKQPEKRKYVIKKQERALRTKEKFFKHIEEKLAEAKMKLPKPKPLDLDLLNKSIANQIRKKQHSCQTFSICKSPKDLKVNVLNNCREKLLVDRLNQADKDFAKQREQAMNKLNREWQEVQRDYCIDFKSMRIAKERKEKKEKRMGFLRTYIEQVQLVKHEKFPYDKDILLERSLFPKTAYEEGDVMRFIREVKFGNLEAVSKMLQVEPLLVFQFDEMQQSGLIWAVKRQNILMARFLLKNFSRVNFRDMMGRTALRFAVDNGDIKMVKVLLCFKADPNVQDNDEVSIMDHYLKTLTKETNLEIGQVLRLAIKQLHANSLIQDGFKFIRQMNTVIKEHADVSKPDLPDQLGMLQQASPNFRRQMTERATNMKTSWTKADIKQRDWKAYMLDVLDPKHELEKDELIDFLDK